MKLNYAFRFWRLCSPHTRTVKKKATVHQIEVTKCRALAYSNGGHLVAVASAATLLIFDSLSLREVASFTGHAAPIKSVAWAANGEPRPLPRPRKARMGSRLDDPADPAPAQT